MNLNESEKMICYSLICSEKHAFESWFSNNEAFKKIKKQNLLSCPVCGILSVEKAIMAPNVFAKRNNASEEKKLPNLSPSDTEKGIAKLKHHIQKNSEDVGNNFAVVARQMHAGETPERSIHGKASVKEAKLLNDEGVPIIPLPWFNRKTN